jgi:hypothetical protein
MRKTGRIKINAVIVTLCPFDPAMEVVWLPIITADFFTIPVTIDSV